MTKPLFLVGFMASGKSTIGAQLADRLALPFVDTDVLVEREFGSSVSDIFRQLGEQAFRDAERRTIQSLLDDKARVVATGGGAFMDASLRDELRKFGTSIWLDPPFEVLSHRLARSSERPLAAARDVHQLRELWEQRRPIYAEADLHVETGDDDPDRVVQQIIDRLQLA